MPPQDLDNESDEDTNNGETVPNSPLLRQPGFEEDNEEEIDEELIGLTQRNRRPYMTRFLLVIILLPSLTYCAISLSDILARYPLSTQWLQIFAVLAGGSAATFLCLRVQFLRSSMVFVLPVAVAVMLLPSYQVYRCSPLSIDNNDLGKTYKLKTSEGEIIERTYLGSECFKETKLQAPYTLSLYTPTVNLTLNSRDVVALFAENSYSSTYRDDLAGEEDEAPQQSMADFFYVRSSRRVKGKDFKLYLLLKVPYYLDNLDNFRQAIKSYSRSKRERYYQIYGTFKKLDRTGKSIRQQYSSKEYIARPLMYVAYSIKTLE